MAKMGEEMRRFGANVDNSPEMTARLSSPKFSE